MLRQPAAIHYHVWNQDNDEPAATTTSYREAKRAAAEEARVWRHDIGAYVRGSAAAGYTIQWDKDGIGGWSLWIADCANPECLNDDQHPPRGGETAMTTYASTEYDRNAAEAEASIQPYAWISRMQDHMSSTGFPDRLRERIEERMQEEQQGALEIAVDRTVRIVLGTGGPHTEIVWPERGWPSIVTYGWFGADRYERELTQDELSAVESTFGEWEQLAGAEECY